MVSERELADLKAKLAERDAEIAALKNKCGRCDSKGTVENSIYCADCLEWYREEYAKHYPSEAEELLAERDRRIGELEGVLRSVQDRLRHREDIREVCYDSCPRCVVDAALAGKVVSRG